MKSCDAIIKLAGSNKNNIKQQCKVMTKNIGNKVTCTKLINVGFLCSSRHS